MISFIITFNEYNTKIVMLVLLNKNTSVIICLYAYVLVLIRSKPLKACQSVVIY